MTTEAPDRPRAEIARCPYHDTLGPEAVARDVDVRGTDDVLVAAGRGTFSTRSQTSFTTDEAQLCAR